MIEFTENKVESRRAFIPIILAGEKGIHAVVGVNIGIADISFLIVIRAAAQVSLYFFFAHALLRDISEKVFSALSQ